MEVGSNQGPKLSPHMAAAMISVVCAVLVFGVWASTGASVVTQYQVATTEVSTDEFGDEIEVTVMADQFQFGLLPDKGYDGALPLGGGLLLIGAVMFVAGKRRRDGAK